MLVAAVGSLSLFNWEVGLLLIAAIIFVIAWPVSRLVRNRPEDYGQHPDGIDPASVPKGSPLNRLAVNRWCLNMRGGKP